MLLLPGLLPQQQPFQSFPSDSSEMQRVPAACCLAAYQLLSTPLRPGSHPAGRFGSLRWWAALLGSGLVSVCSSHPSHLSRPLFEWDARSEPIGCVRLPYMGTGQQQRQEVEEAESRPVAEKCATSGEFTRHCHTFFFIPFTFKTNYVNLFISRTPPRRLCFSPS